MTNLPLFFFTRKGSLPAGTICNEVPRHSDRSAFDECCSALWISSRGNSSSQSKIVSRSLPLWKDRQRKE